MPKLKSVTESVTETVIKVDYSDLDTFIQEVTGQQNYECIADQEWSNDSEHRFTVTGELSRYDRNQWEVFKSKGHSSGYMLRTILDGLCAEKLIPAGIYLVKVCW